MFYVIFFYFLGLGLGSDWGAEGKIWGNGRTEGLGSHPSGISAGGRNQGMRGWKGAGMSSSEGGKKGFFSFNSSSWEVCGASGSASLFLDFPLSQSPGCSWPKFMERAPPGSIFQLLVEHPGNIQDVLHVPAWLPAMNPWVCSGAGRDPGCRDEQAALSIPGKGCRYRTGGMKFLSLP